MWIRPRPTPRHGERSEVRYVQGFRDVDASHGTGTLDQDVCALAGLPRSLQQVVNPSPELLHAFLEERNSEGAVLHTNPHELSRIAADVPKLDTVLQIASASAHDQRLCRRNSPTRSTL